VAPLPRRVLHVLNGASGGAAQSVMALARVLRLRGIESSGVCDLGGQPRDVEVLREAFDGRLERQALYWWNRKVRTATWKRPLVEARQLVRTGWRLRSSAGVALAARRFGVDLVHTNNFLTPEGGVAARWLGLPHVWHVRELLGPGQPFVLAWPRWRLQRFVRAHASMLIANSNATAARLTQVVGGVPVQTTFNGIELGAFERLAAPQGGRPPVFAMVAHLSSRTKKHALFIEAARLAAAAGLQASFRIYGDVPAPGDPYADTLRRTAGAVALMGPERPERIMADIDVLVHPADNESFGRTVVEAMASGRAAIGARGGGVSETIADEETGLVVAPDDARTLAAAIERLARDERLRARLGAAGRERARRLYSIEACGDGVASAYERAMARPLGLLRRS